MRVKIKTRDGEYRFFRANKVSSAAGEGREVVWNVPDEVGKGGFQRLELSAESSISIGRCSIERKYRARVDDEVPSFALIFVLDGSTRSRNSSIPKGLEMVAGSGYLHYLPDPVLEREIDAGQKLHSVTIKMSCERLLTLMGDQRDLVPEVLNRLVDDGLRRPWVCSIGISPLMRVSLLQVSDCPYEGIVRRIFLESKSMELLAYSFEQMGCTHWAGSPEGMNRDDLERVRLARDLLQRDLQYPPSLSDLARSVGMSHPKLNQGFRQLFGCTVFEYLRRQRLELAKALLAENRMSITEIAQCAGFCSSSHLASSFLRRYGVQPNRFRREGVGAAAPDVNCILR